MSSSVKKAVRQFKKKHRISEVTVTSLKSALNEQGYTVVEFNPVYNGEEVDSLIDALGVNDYVRSSRCFTYADSKYRLVFLNEDLNDEEKAIVLSHEEGHIYCNHFKNSPVIGRDVIEEKEANEFSHYLMRNSSFGKPKEFVKKRKAAVIVAVLVMIVLAAALSLFAYVSYEKRYYGDYYVTATGDKYHCEDCKYVENNANAERLTREEFETGKYEPCKVCIPQN